MPVAKTSASVSGMSVSVNACVARRNCSSIGQRSVTTTTMSTSAHQAISGPWIACSWRITRTYSATATAPMTALSHHTGSMEVSFRLAARTAMPVHRQRRARPITPRRYGHASQVQVARAHGATMLVDVHCARVHCALVHCARVHWALRPLRPGPLRPGPGGARRVDPGLDEHLLDEVVRPQALVGAGAGVGRQRARDVELADPAGDGGGRAVRGGDRVVDHRDRAVARQRAPVQRDAVVHRDRREGQDVAGEVRGRPERRGAADLPEDVARLRAVDEPHPAGRGGDQRRAGLEDEDGAGIALRVERERLRSARATIRTGRRRA